jgi:hypothetical protein
LLVLGRDCGRTRRVFTYGFLMLGGQCPIVVDRGFRDNAIMGSLGMPGLQSHENMLERQFANYGAKVGDGRFVVHTLLRIDHAGKQGHVPMNSKPAEKAAGKKLLSNATFPLPSHDLPAKVVQGQIVGRLSMEGPGPITQSVYRRDCIPA